MPTETPAGAERTAPAPAGLGRPITHMVVRLPRTNPVVIDGVWYADSPMAGHPGLVPLDPAGDEIRRQEAVTVEQRLRAEFDAETARQAAGGG